MRLISAGFLLLVGAYIAPEVVFDGSSPQLAVDSRGVIRMVYGHADTVLVATSRDDGESFGSPVVVGVVPGMHLGNTRGPVVASGANYSLVATTDKTGNTHLFQLDHRTGRWTRRPISLNTVDGSAPEGLGTIAAGTNDVFHATWLDYRESRQTHIYFATIPANASAPIQNRRIYASPDGHVCECCRPTVAANGRTVAVMFRNWVAGARDLYLIESRDSGRSFQEARKLGVGTWPLTACPMDGGSMVVAPGGIATVWRRELDIYHAVPGNPETKIGTGRNPMMSARDGISYVVWQDGPAIRLRTLPAGDETIVGEGRLPQVLALSRGRVLVAWERSGRVYTRRI